MNKRYSVPHLHGLHKRWNLFLVNTIFVGTQCFEKKRKMLNAIGYEIDSGTKIVGPIECSGTLKIGKNCWIGKNLRVNGNGTVKIEDNCDIAPEVTFQTGGHKIGSIERRAGDGETYNQIIGKGTWIGGRVTVQGNTKIGNACVIAGCACVTKNVPDNSLVGGVPARPIRVLSND